MFDGVVGGKYNQTDRRAAGDTTVDLVGQMLNQLRLEASCVIAYCADRLAHNLLLAGLFARLLYHQTIVQAQPDNIYAYDDRRMNRRDDNA
jgi:hypothetical protein